MSKVLATALSRPHPTPIEQVRQNLSDCGHRVANLRRELVECSRKVSALQHDMDLNIRRFAAMQVQIDRLGARK
jgi:hypothetical protein